MKGYPSKRCALAKKHRSLYTWRMETSHRLVTGDSRDLYFISDASVHLLLTSPPYPMIRMWDGFFSSGDERIAGLLDEGNGVAAFEAMHGLLDPVWEEAYRVLAPGGFACINIGDALRTLGGRFGLFSNHTRIVQACESKGLTSLPLVLWRKQTNAPNKFMGSGMLPAGAYVTLEHEYILIFRKAGKRGFRTQEEKNLRRRSALFWEERNTWFSDLWDLKGVRQKLTGTEEKGRERSAAFPFELAFRLVHMYSLQGDTVLDPFSGTGTTSLAAMMGGRNSIGVDLVPGMKNSAVGRVAGAKEFLNASIRDRLEGHLSFVRERCAGGGEFRHRNIHYDFPVMTGQERELLLPLIETIDGPFESGDAAGPDGSAWSDGSAGSDRAARAARISGSSTDMKPVGEVPDGTIEFRVRHEMTVSEGLRESLKKDLSEVLPADRKASG